MFLADIILRHFDLKYARFASWLDHELNRTIPDKVVAYCINIYDEGAGRWSIELVGCASFDEQNSDWACDELFSTRHNSLCWKGDAHWRNALEQVAGFLHRYHREGRRSAILNAAEGVAVGFVDGNLIITKNRA